MDEINIESSLALCAIIASGLSNAQIAIGTHLKRNHLLQIHHLLFETTILHHSIRKMSIFIGLTEMCLHMCFPYQNGLE
jgi:hypothetical protein